MTIGLSTYAFFWQWHETASTALSWQGMLDKTADWGVELFQFCDYPPLHSMTVTNAAQIARYAEHKGVALELGTRGLNAHHMLHYLNLARASGTSLVRGMVPREDGDRAVALLRAFLPAYEKAGVSIALETYEQVPTQRLVQIVHEVGSEYLGICLDPANSVAALEKPTETIDATADLVKNLHVKDFAFTRQAGWVGFTYAGARLGEGLLDYDALVARVRPREREINQIIEHWLVWQGDSATTCALEDQWTQHNIHYLRKKQS